MEDWTLFTAELDGFPLEIENLDDTFEKAIAKYEIPYKRGAILEDLGEKARPITIRCHFWDDDTYHQTYGAHIEFVNSLKENRLRTLTHPMYGKIEGYVERVHVRHDERIMYAEVDVTFIEDARKDLAAVEYELVDIDEAAIGSYSEAQQQLMDSFADEVAADTGISVAVIKGKELDPLTAIAEQYSGVALPVRNYLKRIDAFVSVVQADLTMITQPPNGITSAINFGNSLPGRVIGSLAACMERYSVLFDTVDSVPTRFLKNLDSALDSLGARLGWSKQAKGAKAAQINLSAAAAYKRDQLNRSKAIRAESAKAFSISGQHSPAEAIDPVMTVQDLEETLAVAGDAANAALTLDRSLDAVKQGYRQLVDHVNGVKLRRENIVQITVDNPMPLHLLCHVYGLPYSAAERVHSINRIVKPNETSGTVNMYVR